MVCPAHGRLQAAHTAHRHECATMQPRIALQARWVPSQRASSSASGGRRRATRSRARQQEQREAGGLQGGSQGAEEDLPDFQLPKFMPFTPHNALHRAMTSFRRWHACPNGQTLLVMPLSAQHIRPAADLLTDSFAEAMAAMPYKNYLRRQVRQYLEAHAQLPPKAVVLVALLLPAPDGGEPAEAAAGHADEGSSGSGSSSSSSDSSRSGVDLAQSSSGSVSAVQHEQQQQQQPESSPSAHSSLELGDGMAQHPLPPAGGSPSDGASTDAAAELPEAAVLAGVVELSFSASTRSKHLTLTPPEDRPYLCNMAVAEALRGRGYGTALLRAAESLVAELGETEVYLHLRVQDLPAAALYARAGYEQVAADSFLVRLLAQDQRRLMRKRLPKPA